MQLLQLICTSIFICCSTVNAFEGLEKEGKAKERGKKGRGDTPGC